MERCETCGGEGGFEAGGPICCGNAEWECGAPGCTGPIDGRYLEQCPACNGTGEYQPHPEATMIEELKALHKQMAKPGEIDNNDLARLVEMLPAILSALEAVPAMKEALGNAYETLSIIADAADEDQVKLAAREATTGISQALAALEPKP